MKTDDLKSAIESGAATTGAIAEELGKDASTIRRRAKRAAESDATDIVRERNPNGGGYVYGIEQAGEEVDDQMPVFGGRAYEWSQYVPPPGDDVYMEVDGERSDMEAIIESRDVTGQLPRFRLTGPPGTGKTTLAESIGAKYQFPVIPIQFTASMRDSELLGSPHLIGGESVYVDGPIVKALLCSQERPVVVILDEVNRAPFHRKSSLQPFLDHRGQATIELRGGEVIEGDPENIITIATMNEGAEYETYQMDPAERRRHGNTWEVPYLGLIDRDREASIVADRTPVDMDLARLLVDGANDVRRLATEDDTSPVTTGITTSTLLEWAKTAAAYRSAGHESPVEHAARTAVVEPHFDEHEGPEVYPVLLDNLHAVVPA
ncbi:AAA family ATPase [Halobaculum magnesiiphilum]|uniref:CbbQ/NirQ/NorQ/GpvN family protein n=1 Tax=Halobaculum magnesiiphilum TaxID=1017351 RepID=A0A8T8WB88_9EURY|nr:AAA family ATPase [Halobaculum magnesiiphilum]QZP37081.1 CbbQ/NirQ/NorQ/GpvN family protein [Halobaculum magnesiiphilum]